ncbi:PorP/SprF family type IX secretion system membrane protein [Crocinitomix algicola]|uniref:PorP/SprF family type IX secretion system membrane protein n=1 Tax=Crocinitomix algicola TaxID=1740263 RepID=UPI0008324BC7|nr:PorP/SprF family type IX secretion system membrane protein [Crocinitomix algicola]
MKRFLTKTAVLILALGAITEASAQQDKHFSMFSESPVFLNPAAAGFSDEQMQLFTNFRSQWLTVSEQPYRTISASADWRMLDQNADKGTNFLGAGITFYNDKSGVSNYTTNVISFPINYAFQVGQKDHFSIGLQPAFYQRSVNGSSLTWDNQWTGVEFDQGINNNELLLNQNLSVSRFDMSAGVYWEKYIGKFSKINLGLAGHHLTKQRVNILNDDSKLYRKVTLHGEGTFQTANTNVQFKPALIGFLQGPNKELTAGTAFRFALKSESQHTAYFGNMHLTLGSYFRINDALIAMAILEMNTLSIGASYDLNVSRLNVASKGVGAMEFFLRYKFNYEGRTLANPSVKKTK